MASNIGDDALPEWAVEQDEEKATIVDHQTQAQSSGGGK